MGIPSNHTATRLEGSQLDEELSPENMTVGSISPTPPEVLSLKDGEIVDLILV